MASGNSVDPPDANRVPLSGATLIVGPSGAGKTRLTARTLENWLDVNGARDVVVLEFGPSIEHEGRLVGGRLDRFVDVPDAVFHGVLDAKAPRLEGDSAAATRELARQNAERATRIFDALPSDPAAVFVNDATIPFQHESADVTRLTRYADRATCAVVNAYEGESLDVGDDVSNRERDVLGSLREWADRVVSLG
ncbi:MAG: hypothetical protein ACOCSF_02600 [Halanaeroarchaeum sp.]